MQKKRNFSILIRIFIFSLLFGLCLFIPITNAANLQAVQESGKFGGKFYSVKVFNTYYLAGNEAGFQIYSNVSPPLLQGDFFPAQATAYSGGASGLGIPNFKTGVDAKSISGTNYAFYADGKYVYALNISIVANIREADSIAIPNVRAVRVEQINSYYYAFALAYQTGAPGTTMLYVLDVDDPTNMQILGSLDLNKDNENPNNTGGCAMDYVLADFDGDGTSDDPYLFIADGTEGIKAVNLSNLYNSQTMPLTGDITATETSGTAQGIDVVWFGSTLYAFVADGSQGLKIFVVTDPTDMPTDDDDKIGSVGFSAGIAYDVKVLGTTVVIANGSNGLRVVDVADPTDPEDVTMGQEAVTANRLSDINSLNPAFPYPYDPLNGTAYGLDFHYDTTTVATRPQLLPVVAWGEAGLIKTDVNLAICPDGDPGAAFGSTVEAKYYDGTYVWLLHDDGSVSRITPGGDLTGAADIITSSADLFNDPATGAPAATIVSAGGYVYGIYDPDPTLIARFAISSFTATQDPTVVPANTAATNDGGGGGTYSIKKIFTDGTNIFFLDDTSVGHAEKEIYRVVTSTFGTGTDVIESGSSFANVATCPYLVSDGSYIYGRDSAVAGTQIRRVPVNFTAGNSGEVTTDVMATAVTILFTDTDGEYVMAVGTGGTIGWLTTDSTFATATIKETSDVAFTISADLPLIIIGDYIYGIPLLPAADASRLTRRAIDWANGDAIGLAAPMEESITDCTQNIILLLQSGTDIYAINTSGVAAAGAYVNKYITSQWGGTPDAVATSGVVFDEDILTAAAAGAVAAGNFILADGTTALQRLNMVGFVGNETSHGGIAQITLTGATDHFAGYARDVVLSIDAGGLNDFAYVSNSEKGIIRFTLNNDPTDVTAWTVIFKTDVRTSVLVADKTIDDPQDIQDARGIDYNAANTLVLLADGSAGIKLVMGDLTDLQTNAGAGTTADGDGYMSQSYDSGVAGADLGEGTAEDVKYFTFNSKPYAALANGSAGVAIIDINANNAAAIGDMAVKKLVDTDGYAYSVAVDTDPNNYFVYVGDGPNGLAIIELDPNETGNDLTLAELLNNTDNVYTAGASYTLRSVILDDSTDPSYAFLAYGSKGVVILDVTDPANPVVTDSYPSSGLINGEAYDVAYDSTTNTLYAAMSYGAILSLDVTDKENIILKGGLDTYGKALGLAYGDVDGSSPHLFIANGSGGFLAASIETQPHIIIVLPNIQPVDGGDTIKIIGSGFDGTTTVTVTDGTNETLEGTDYISSSEITFTAPASPTGLPGKFDLKVTRGTVYETLSDALEYLPGGQPIIEMSAAETGSGKASPGGLVPVDLVIRENGAAEVTSVTARIKYNITQFSVATDAGGSVSSSAFEVNGDIEKTAYMMLIDTNPSDNYKTLNIIIYSTETGVNKPIPDGSRLGTVYMTVLSANSSDITLTLDSSTEGGISQQVSTSLEDYVAAYGSSADIYVKPAPMMVSTYTPEESYAAGYSSDTFGPFLITVSEFFDSTDYIEDAEVTFTVPANALVDADDPNATAATAFTVVNGYGTLSSSDATSITVLTNSSGQAKVTLNVGTVADEYTMTISGEYNDSTLTGSTTTPIVEDFTVTAETTASDPNDSISLSYTPTNPTTGGTVTITATAYDKYGNPMSGETISFATSQGTLSAATAATDDDGHATVTLTLANTVSSHTFTATYDTSTTASLTIAPAGPDVNADGSWSSSSDIQTAINYHLNWTDLTTALKPSGRLHVPGDTNENDRFDLNEVIALINLALGI